MGDRSNYVIVQDGRWELFYSHWGAVSLELDLLAGPDAATRFIRAQRAVDPDAGGWLDDVWCEGAALVDHDRRRLCFFTLHYEDPDGRAAVLAVMAHTWAGWRVDWAYDGLADLVAHVGQDRSIVRAESDACEPEAAYDDWVNSLVTVAGGDAYALNLDASEVITHGPDILGMLPGEARRTCYDVIPNSGVHLDPVTRTAGVWTLQPLVGALDRAPLLWPGWRWEMWADRHTEQLARLSGQVTLPKPDLPTALEVLRERFERHRGDDPAAQAQALLGRLADDSLVTSPYFFDHEIAPPAQAEYATVLTAIAVAGRPV